MPSAGTNFKIAWAATIETGVNDTLHLHTNALDDDVVVAAGTYYFRNDGTAGDLVKAFQNALNTNTHGGTYVVTLLSTGVMHVTCNLAFALRWNDGPTTLPKATFGFNGNTGSTGVPYQCDSTNQVQNIWVPEQPYIRDTEDQPNYNVAMASSLDGHLRHLSHGVVYTREIEIDILPPNKVWIASEVEVNESFERCYAALAAGEVFEFCRDWIAHPSVYTQYQINDEDWIKTWPLVIPTQLILLYTLTIKMQKVVP